MKRWSIFISFLLLCFLAKGQINPSSGSGGSGGGGCVGTAVTPCVVAGTAASGTTASGSPVQIGGIFNTSPSTLTTGQQGVMQLDASQNALIKVNVALPAGTNNIGSVTPATNTSGADGVLNTALGSILTNTGNAPLQGVQNIFNGTSWDRIRAASLANFPTSQTKTSVNAIGAAIGEKGARWSVVSNPGGSAQATASIAAEAAVRHVVDCVAFSATDNGTVTATDLVVNIRDGATGAGTILWSWVVANQFPSTIAAGEQYIAPHTICGLNLVGTTNTAMTVEFSAGVTALIEAVSFSGYNVN